MPFLQIAPELQLQVVGEPARPLPRVIFCAISLPAHAERGTPGWGVVAAVVLHQVVDHPLLHKSSSAQAISPSLAVTQSVKGRNHNRLSLAIPPLRAFSKGHTRKPAFIPTRPRFLTASAGRALPSRSRATWRRPWCPATCPPPTLSAARLPPAAAPMRMGA